MATIELIIIIITKAQFTPPDQTRRDKTVLSRRRCALLLRTCSNFTFSVARQSRVVKNPTLAASADEKKAVLSGRGYELGT